MWYTWGANTFCDPVKGTVAIWQVIKYNHKFVKEDGKWRLDVPLGDMFLDEAGVETFKTHFYAFEGWDTSTGWPSRSTLESLGLKRVADELESAGKLGASGTYTGE
jgi:hypothetical protein